MSDHGLPYEFPALVNQATRYCHRMLLFRVSMARGVEVTTHTSLLSTNFSTCVSAGLVVLDPPRVSYPPLTIIQRYRLQLVESASLACRPLRSLREEDDSIIVLGQAR